MKSIYSRILLFTLLFSLFIACQKVLDMNIDSQPPRLVMYAHLQPDSLVAVFISSSVHILKRDSLIAVNAKVSLYENGNFIETLTNTAFNKYVSNSFKPTIGNEYTITAEAEGYKTISGSTKIPIQTEISKIDTFTQPINNSNAGNREQFVISPTFTDPAEIGNYYCISINTFDSIENMSYSQYVNTKYLLFEINSWGGDDFQLIDNNNTSLFGDISNYTILSGNLYMSDIAINGKVVTFNLNIDDNYYFDPSNPNGLVTAVVKTKKIINEVSLKSISKDFFLYAKSKALYQSTNQDIFSEKVKVYNNVKNGFGLVSSESASKKSITRYSKYIEYKTDTINPKPMRQARFN